MGLPKLLISLPAAPGRVARTTSKTRERDSALFGDRQADDPRRGIAHRGDQTLGTFGRDEKGAQRADDAQILTLGPVHGERTEGVLRRQRVPSAQRRLAPQIAQSDSPAARRSSR